jgi:hypothetical protein
MDAGVISKGARSVISDQWRHSLVVAVGTFLAVGCLMCAACSSSGSNAPGAAKASAAASASVDSSAAASLDASAAAAVEEAALERDIQAATSTIVAADQRGLPGPSRSVSGTIVRAAHLSMGSLYWVDSGLATPTLVYVSGGARRDYKVRHLYADEDGLGILPEGASAVGLKLRASVRVLRLPRTSREVLFAVYVVYSDH